MRSEFDMSVNFNFVGDWKAADFDAGVFDELLNDGLFHRSRDISKVNHDIRT